MIFFCLHFLLAGEESHYQKGINLLEDGQYQQSVDELHLSLQTEAIDPNIYHALGNALYFQEKTILAKAAWKRGIILQPGHLQITYNLQQLNGVRVPLSLWEQFSLFQWSGMGSVMGILGLFFLWGKRNLFRLSLAWVSLGSCAFCAYCSWESYSSHHNALILHEHVVAGSAPRGGIDLFVLTKGDEVRLIQQRQNNMVLISNSQSQRGWVSSSSMITLGPWDDFSPLMR